MMNDENESKDTRASAEINPKSQTTKKRLKLVLNVLLENFNLVKVRIP